ncbi:MULTISPECIES: integrase arm-type DNA-binding domain-containing protein [Pseudomonas]|uniref:tyrosine-type recombinase/integrase n=1 Tax=Pseudomonas TaxID=286 RepID=UPI000CFC9318|nr:MULTISPECIES: integrase arm-type DNA-binding domain-containing protein [Pseudomonas]PQZ87292.1 hypothetical protein CQ048_20925 [Pseudomonas trivialis]PRB24322.1 hypothetical protein CQ041_20130 [Pseudomonas sp. MYb60]
MALTDTAVRQAKPYGKNYALKDSGGLATFVGPRGAKQWHFRFYWLGKQARISFGVYPAVSLKEARTARDEARALVAQGIDPRANRREARLAASASTENSIRSVFKDWRAFRALSLNAGRQSALSQIDRHFDKDILPKPKVRHNPHLRMDELPLFLHKLRSCGGHPNTVPGIRFPLLTGVRTGELRAAKPEQFDLERGLWIIPAEGVKQLQVRERQESEEIPPYIVPLSRPAVEIIKGLLAAKLPAQSFLLPHRSKPRESISENTLNNTLKRMGYEAQLTGRGRGDVPRAVRSEAMNEVFGMILALHEMNGDVAFLPRISKYITFIVEMGSLFFAIARFFGTHYRKWLAEVFKQSFDGGKKDT